MSKFRVPVPPRDPGFIPWDQFSPQEQAAAMQRFYSQEYDTPNIPPPAPQEPGLFRELGDTATSFGQGAIGAVKALTDLAGADNPVSSALDYGIDTLGDWQSDYQKAQRAEHARRMQEAEASGDWRAEVRAGFQNIAEDPIDYIMQGAGSLVVPFGAGRLAKAAQLGKTGTTATLGGLGAGMGVGAVKGAQYEGVYNAEMAKHGDPARAAEVASRAQSYSQDNAVDLLTGGALGLVAGIGPAERIAAMGLAPSLTGKKWVQRGFIGSVTEATPEGAQGGQERLATNRALNREGYGVDPWTGVTGQFTQDALISAPLGGGLSIAQGYQPTQAERDAAAAEARLQASQQTQDWAAEQQRGLVRQEEEAKAQAEAAKRADYLTRAAQSMPFSQFKEVYADTVKRTNAEIKRATKEAIDDYQLMLVTGQAETDQKTHVQNFLAARGLTKPLSPEEAYKQRVEELADTLAFYDSQEAQPEPTPLDRAQFALRGVPNSYDQGLTREAPAVQESVVGDVDAGIAAFQELQAVDSVTQESDLTPQVMEPATIEESPAVQLDATTETAPATPLSESAPAPVTTPVDVPSAQTTTAPLQDEASPPVENAAPTPAPVTTPAKARAVVNEAAMSGVIPTKQDKEALIALAQRDPTAAVAAVEELYTQDQATNIPPPEVGTVVTQLRAELPVDQDLDTTGVAQLAEVPGLSTQERQVAQVLDKAISDNDLELFLRPDGTWNSGALAKAAGLVHRNANGPITRTMNKLAKNFGVSVDELRAALRAKGVKKRKVEDSDFDKRGLPPSEQSSVVDTADLFGNEEGAEPSMGIISGVSDAQGAVGERDIEGERMALARPDPVAEQRVAVHNAKMQVIKEQLQDEVLRQPIAAEAAKMWDKWAPKNGVKIKADQLSKQQAYEWVLAYKEYSDGVTDDDQIDADQKDIAKDSAGERAGASDRVTDESVTATPAVEQPVGPEASRTNQANLGQAQQRPTETTDEQRTEVTGAGERQAQAAEGVDSAPRFSKTEGAKGTTRQAVEAVVQELTGKQSSLQVVVYNSDADAVQAGTLTSQEANGKVQAWVEDGKAYFIAGNIPQGAELAVFLHEVGAHIGLENMLTPTQYARLVGQINKWATRDDGSVEAKVAKAALARVKAAKTKAGDMDAETIAYFVEEAVKAGIDPTARSMKSEIGRWFDQLMRAFRTALMKLGINPNALTAQDVVNLAYGAAQQSMSTQAGVASNSRMSSVAAQSATPPQGAFSKLGEAIDAFMVDPKTKLDEWKQGWMTLEQLADRTKLDSVRNYVKVIHAMQARHKDLTALAKPLDRRWADLGEEKATKLGDVMVRSTLAEYDPTTTAPSNADEVKIKADLANLGKDAEQLYKDVRDFYKQVNEQKRDILKSLSKKAGKSSAEVDKMFAEVKGPYFPLMRTGDWYAVLMSNEVRALTLQQREGTISKADEAKLARLRKDPKQYMTKSFRSRSEAEKFAKASGFPYSHVNKQELRIAKDVTSLPDFAKVESYIGKELDGVSRDKLRDILAEMYYDMSQSEAHKRMMRREGIHGAQFGRAEFARSAVGQAHVVSRMEFAEKLNEAMVAVKKDSIDGNVDARTAYIELQARNALAMDQDQPHWVVDAALKGSYFAHLGMSPAYWLTNMSQTPMITLPWLAARHGLGSSTNALATAFTEVKDIMKSSYKDGGWRFEFDWSKKFPKGSGEDRMLRALLERNKLDITIEHDLMAVAEGKHSRLNDAIQFVNTPVRSIELVNRGMTALAAYRLALKKFNGDQDKAIEHAIKAVNDTQLDYSMLNSARYMQSVMGSKSLARVMMQFRKFQQGMIYLIASSAYDAVKGESDTVKSEARKTLFGLAATTSLMAGSLGIPAAGTVMFIANLIGQAFDDDDEPFDAQTEYRNWLVSVFGKDMADVVAKGLPAMLNIDASKRVGMGDIFSPVPFYRAGSTGQESVNNLIANLGGAPVATVGMITEGIRKIGEGDFVKGAEQVIPLKLAQNVIRAARYSSEGMTDKQGDVILADDRFSPWDISLRAIGFSTTEESNYYEGNKAIKDAEFAVKKARSKLIREATEDGINMTDAIHEFNQRHPSNRITYRTLLDSVRRKSTMQAERGESGIRFNKQNQDFADRAAFAEDELAYE